MTVQDEPSSSGAQLPDPSLPAPPLNDDEEGFTAEQLIQRQMEMEEAAREAVPFSFTKGGCTYDRGYIRQPVFACRTCGGGGVCAGCSVGCHAEHDLVELFAKRAFRCDCGTLSLCRGKKGKEAQLAPCALRSKELSFAPQNDENVYNKNFDGGFCRCERGKAYNPETEEETMLQCLCCEDWVHESCSSLRPSKAINDFDQAQRALADGPLVDHDSFEHFVCSECICKPGNEVDNLKAIDVVARGDGWQHPWKVYGLPNGSVGLPAQVTEECVPNALATVQKEVTDAASSLLKRNAEDDAKEEPAAQKKRARMEGGLTVLDSFSDADEDGTTPDEPLISCRPEQDTVDDTACVAPSMPLFAAKDHSPRLDVYLTESFRDRICRCCECIGDWTNLSFVLDAEETYSPPRSASSSQRGGDGQSEAGASQTSSTYDLGLAALNRLPRERMMESLQAYNKMRDALFDHLRPFADQGKVVDAESVREFFRKQREGQNLSRED